MFVSAGGQPCGRVSAGMTEATSWGVGTSGSFFPSPQRSKTMRAGWERGSADWYAMAVLQGRDCPARSRWLSFSSGAEPDPIFVSCLSDLAARAVGVGLLPIEL